jgi:hypothetical protein
VAGTTTLVGPVVAHPGSSHSSSVFVVGAVWPGTSRRPGVSGISCRRECWWEGSHGRFGCCHNGSIIEFCEIGLISRLGETEGNKSEQDEA